MNLNFRNLPNANLPYNEISLCKQMMLRLYESSPFLAELPLILPSDNIISRTIQNIPGIVLNEKKLLLSDINSPEFAKSLSHMDKVYNSDDCELIKQYSSDSPFFFMYLEMLKRIKPKYTVIKLIGPYSLTETIFNQNTATLLTDKIYRKFLTQAIGIKAAWFINTIKEVSPNTKILFLFEEQQLHKFGTLKRINPEITNDTVINIFTKLFQKIQKNDALVGLQSFEKCNWILALESNVDLISFDAYNNSNSLNIIAERINEFLSRGGYINWAIVQCNNENAVHSLNFENVYKNFINATESLSDAGVSLDLIYKNCTVSVNANLAKLPILYAEKALMIESQLSKKIPISSRK